MYVQQQHWISFRTLLKPGSGGLSPDLRSWLVRVWMWDNKLLSMTGVPCWDCCISWVCWISCCWRSCNCCNCCCCALRLVEPWRRLIYQLNGKKDNIKLQIIKYTFKLCSFLFLITKMLDNKRQHIILLFILPLFLPIPGKFVAVVVLLSSTSLSGQQVNFLHSPPHHLPALRCSLMCLVHPLSDEA